MNYFTEELKQELQNGLGGNSATPTVGGLGSNPSTTTFPEQEATPYVQPVASGIVNNSVDTQEILDYITTYNNGENVNPEDSYETLTPLEETLNQIVDPLILDTSTSGAGVAMVPAGGQPISTVSVSGGADVDAKAGRTRSSIQEANTERTNFTNSFYMNIGINAEKDHGDTPQVSNDAQDKASGTVTYDIGYGHKITSSEFSSGEIHGIPFIDDNGEYIPLTQEQKEEIMFADFAMHQRAARDNSWDKKLADRGSSWDELDTGYQNALTSLAYNVGGFGEDGAGVQWTDVLDDAIAGSRATDDAEERAAIVRFAANLRRKDSGDYTAGMDNRVAKELYYAGLIDSIDDISTVLPLASAADTNIPQSAEFGTNPNRRPTGSQD